MNINELQHLLQQQQPVDLHIQSHHEGVYCTVEIRIAGEVHRLAGQKNKPLVFRDEESARNLLQQAGIARVKSQRILSRLSTLAKPVLEPRWSAGIA